MLRPEAVRSALPVHLAARVRALAPLGANEEEAKPKAHVLYWMRAGLSTRAHENPALDAAVVAANALQLPLRVLVHVEDNYAHGTARRQMFLIEGAREVCDDLLTGCEGRLAVEVCVDRRAGEDEFDSIMRDGWVRLTGLAAEAALVVTEEPFCSPFIGGLMRLQQALGPEDARELWSVDCTSVVPSRAVAPRDCNRCFAYEKATQQAHNEAMRSTWPVAKLENGAAAFDKDDTSATTLAALAGADDLMQLVAAARVDQGVPPVAGTVGGSKAGYARWEAWMRDRGGLKTYAQRRGDALDPAGVSRMSGYVNAGFVSSMRLAREAKRAGGAGVEKWLNEFLSWRGMSVAYCYHGWSVHACPSLGRGKVSAPDIREHSDPGLWLLPTWAQRTLQEHRHDPRGKVFSRDELAYGRTNDGAWNGMQQYLVETGELHNNARMGWGGAVVGWTDSPEEAMATLVDLNHTFAYDGHAPPSYGGLFSSLGLFAGQRDRDARVWGKVKQPNVKGRYAAMGKADAMKRVLSIDVQSSDAAADCARRIFAPLARAPPAVIDLMADLPDTDGDAKRRRWHKKEPKSEAA